MPGKNSTIACAQAAPADLRQWPANAAEALPGDPTWDKSVQARLAVAMLSQGFGRLMGAPRWIGRDSIPADHCVWRRRYGPTTPIEIRLPSWS